MRTACAAFVAVMLSGCGGGDRTPPTSADEVTPVRVYFVRGEQLGSSTRESTEGAEAALRELLAGPLVAERGAGLETAIPRATELRAVTIEGSVATVDLSGTFQSGGGSTSMALRAAQVVYTLTQFPRVERVAFLLDGVPVDAIGGEGVIVSPPVGRAAFEDQTPAILVESVGPGDEVSSPLRVTGTANTFEATLNLRIVDRSGRVLYDDFATATSGSGARGTFDETIEFDGEGSATLVAYERSAADGSEINVVAIPVELRR